MLVLTGFKAALAAEIVSFWICISAALLDLFSPVGFPSELGRTLEEELEDELIVDEGTDEAAVEIDPAEADDGSAVIRSISVVPDESAMIDGRSSSPNSIDLVRLCLLAMLPVLPPLQFSLMFAGHRKNSS